MFDLSALSFRHDASVSLYICSPISLAAYKCMHASRPTSGRLCLQCHCCVLHPLLTFLDDAHDAQTRRQSGPSPITFHVSHATSFLLHPSTPSPRSPCSVSPAHQPTRADCPTAPRRSRRCVAAPRAPRSKVSAAEQGKKSTWAALCARPAECWRTRRCHYGAVSTQALDPDSDAAVLYGLRTIPHASLT
jgi:hypothetical protein